MVVSIRDEAEEFREGLRALGYVEGRDVTLDLRSAEGNDDRSPDLAADLVRLPVDLIYAVSTPPTQAAKQASSAIPIVMVAGGNPVDTGLVASLAHPGGNVTGVSFLDRPLEGKRLELLKEAVPSIARVAVVGGQANPALDLTWADLQGDAPALGLALESVRVRAPEELSSALASAARAGVDAVLILGKRSGTSGDKGRRLLDFLLAAGDAALQGTAAPSVLPAPRGHCGVPTIASDAT